MFKKLIILTVIFSCVSYSYAEEEPSIEMLKQRELEILNEIASAKPTKKIVSLKNVDKGKTNKTIQNANNVLKTSKETVSKKAIKTNYYTISYDYFDEEETKDGAYFVYTNQDVSLHTLPSLSSKLIYLVKANTKLKLDKNHGPWYRVKSADNKYGWILGDMICFNAPSDTSALKIRGKGF